MNLQNSSVGVNGSSEVEQNGVKIKTEDDNSEDVEMETPPPEERNGHTNGYQNGNSHAELVEDMGEFKVSSVHLNHKRFLSHYKCQVTDSNSSDC